MPFAEAPAGIIGLEAAVPVCLTHLVHAGVLTLDELVARFTTGPARILGLPLGTLALGAPADVTVLDPDSEVVLDLAEFLSRSQNCPYQGWHCRGRAVATLVAGEWAWHDLAQLAQLAQPIRTPRCPWSSE